MPDLQILSGSNIWERFSVDQFMALYAFGTPSAGFSHPCPFCTMHLSILGARYEQLSTMKDLI